jgi:hypothetical protein
MLGKMGFSGRTGREICFRIWVRVSSSSSGGRICSRRTVRGESGKEFGLYVEIWIFSVGI